MPRRHIFDTMNTINSKPGQNAAFIIAILLFIMLFVCEAEVREGTAAGLSVCAQAIIPSMFPMLILSSFITQIRTPRIISKVLSVPVGILSGLSENTAKCFMLGGFCGYPVGVKTACALLRDGSISQEEARRAALINVNPGAAFAVLVVGRNMFGSKEIGLRLYLSVTAANLMISFALRCFHRTTIIKTNKRETGALPPSQALVQSVASASTGIFSICAWITTFFGFASPLQSSPAGAFLRPFLEVTAAAASYAKTNAVPACAFSLGFGGLCIMFQLLPELKELGVSAGKYLAFRFAAGGIAFLLQHFTDRIFPSAAPVFSYIQPAQPRFSAFGASASLMFFCVVFMASIGSVTGAWAPTKK